MNVVYTILVTIAVIVAISFSLLVLVTGKGDAMSGGGSIRTTFKGKASFDDIMSKWTLYMGVAFMAIVLVIDVLAKKLDTAPIITPGASAEQSTPSGNVSTTPSLPVATPAVPPATTPTGNAPTGNAPAGNPPSTAIPDLGSSTPSTNAPLNSAPATVPSTTANSGEGTVVPTVPSSGNAAGGTTAGGAANAAPPANTP